jgi:hypothetical protein
MQWVMAYRQYVCQQTKKHPHNPGQKILQPDALEICLDHSQKPVLMPVTPDMDFMPFCKIVAVCPFNLAAMNFWMILGEISSCSLFRYFVFSARVESGWIRGGGKQPDAENFKTIRRKACGLSSRRRAGAD